MTRRRVLCGLLLASVVLACFGSWLWMVSRPRVSRATFEQVHEGMSREEVWRIMGGPPKDYVVDRAIGFDRLMPYDRWLCDDAVLLVLFDDEDTVNEVHIGSGPPTFTERIRRWLGL
jgi:hypothetical protein